jgi:hypothetical protein
MAWLRILAGGALIVVSVAAADQVRKGLQQYSAGVLKVDSVGQGQFLTWQFAVLGVLVGGGLAGATTGAGARHGIFAGGLGAVGVLGATAMQGESLTPIAYWLKRLSLGELAPTDPLAVGAAVGGVLLLGLIGGWLGGSLFQPLAPPHRLRTGID